MSAEAWELWPPEVTPLGGPEPTVCDPADVADMPARFALLGFGTKHHAPTSDPATH